MTMVMTPGMFSQVMYDSQQAGALEAVFDRFLTVELDGNQMDAQRMGEFATQVASSISEHYDEFSAALSPAERQNVERIAESNGIEIRPATVEYLSNGYLFRAIRDFFGLPGQEVFPQMDTGGFLAFTWNGSIIASPPEDNLKKRTFHYARMPSRKKAMESSIRQGELQSDIAVSHRLYISTFTASAVRRLLYIPASQAPLFDKIRQSMTDASLSVSMFITKKPE